MSLEDAVREQLVKQTELLLDSERMTAETLLSAFEHEITEMTAEIERYITSGTVAAGNRINQANTRIPETHTVYSSLPAGQQKRTLDDLYAQQAILEREREAARLFREGKYTMTSAQYAAVVRAQPENMEARFYELYSLFLSNKLDRGNYRQIKEGLQTLERYGFYRVETREILERNYPLTYNCLLL
jgi:hypothetical protein